MPLYEYYCSHCRAKFEMLVSHRFADDVVCMKCHSEKVRRLLSVFAAPRGEGDNSDYETAPSGCSCGGSCGCQ